jgi:hypothetical protein
MTLFCFHILSISSLFKKKMPRSLDAQITENSFSFFFLPTKTKTELQQTKRAFSSKKVQRTLLGFAQVVNETIL